MHNLNAVQMLSGKIKVYVVTRHRFSHKKFNVNKRGEHVFGCQHENASERKGKVVNKSKFAYF